MKDENLIILAGGLASRMKKSENTDLDEATQKEANEKTKSMIRIDGSRPFLDYLVLNAIKAGYINIHIVIGEKDSSIKNHYDEIKHEKLFETVNFSFSVQKIPEGREKPLGTADALLTAFLAVPEFKNQKVTVCNSDNLYSVEALKLMLNTEYPNALINYDRDGFLFEKERVRNFAVNITDEDNYLRDIIEKPADDIVERIMTEKGFVGVSMNCFRFSYDMLLPELIAVPLSERNEKELPQAVKMMMDKNPKSVFTYRLSEHVADLTSKNDISIVKEYIKNNYGID